MAEKVIVITGANGGLGRALAQGFAADGHRVLMLGRTLAKVEEVAAAIGERASPIQCDVSSPDSVRTAFAKIAESHPRIDVLINNAAIFLPFLTAEASDAQIVNTVMTNLAGPMLVSRSAIPMLNRGGHIINISSESVELQIPHLLAYEATKAGLERYSRGLRDEMEDEERGIRVTVVRAGSMLGPGISVEMTAETAGHFYAAAAKRGIDLLNNPHSSYEATLAVFRMIVDSPPDIQVGTITLHARKAD